jgi:hypothetical protein
VEDQSIESQKSLADVSQTKKKKLSRQQARTHLLIDPIPVQSTMRVKQSTRRSHGLTRMDQQVSIATCVNWQQARNEAHWWVVQDLISVQAGKGARGYYTSCLLLQFLISHP